MKALPYILYVFSALLMLSAVLIFLPWSTLNAWMAFFAPVAYPATPTMATPADHLANVITRRNRRRSLTLSLSRPKLMGSTRSRNL